MRFQARLILLVTCLLTVTTMVDTALHAWKTYDALLKNAETSAERVAKLLARSAAFGSHVSRDIEAATGDMMVAQAHLTALYVAAAERAGISTAEITNRLAAVAAKTQIDEFWITDPAGHAYIHTLEGVDFTFDPDPAKQPQAHRFWPLLTGAAETVVQEARRRELDNTVFKYVGVPGVDKRRIVEVGVNVGFLDQLSARMGLPGLVGALVGEGDINAIWVLNRGLDTVAHASLLGTEVNPGPDPEETLAVAQVLAEGRTAHVLTGMRLTVIAPVHDGDGVIGAALVRLSTAHMDRAVREQMWVAAISALVVIAFGTACAAILARRQTQPVRAMTHAARAMEKGDFDPAELDPLAPRHDEFGTLAKVFQVMAREVAAREEHLEMQVRERTLQIETKHAQLMTAHRRIDEELEIARSFQIAMLPQGVVQAPGYEMFGFMRPAREVGGDFYDHFAIDRHRLCLVVGDVSGKGVPAALFMVQARDAIQAAIGAGQGPGAALAAVNDRLLRNNPLELFVTIFVAVYDSRTGVLTFASAGHPPPLVTSPDAPPRPLPRTGGMVVGALEGLTFREAQQTLIPGQSLLLYSDGITEAMNAAGELFGDERLSSALAGTAGLSAKDLALHAAAAAERFAEGAEQADDMTCLVLRCLETGGEDALADEPATLSLALAGGVADIPRVIAAIEAFCAEHGIDARTFGDVHLALDEWLANVVHYAWNDQPGRKAPVEVSVEGRRLVVEIQDDGPAFDPLAQATPDLDSPLEERLVGGLGIHLIRSVMDEVHYRRKGNGNVLTLVKTLAG